MSSSIKERSAFCITTTCYSLLVLDPVLEGGAHRIHDERGPLRVKRLPELLGYHAPISSVGINRTSSCCSSASLMLE